MKYGKILVPEEFDRSYNAKILSVFLQLLLLLLLLMVLSSENFGLLPPLRNSWMASAL